ncbi:MAG: hypothetical protein U9P38_01905 [Campylobacterota bacterium]|nr:hypothetical protein [Campylobacterota bacterium]
MKINFIKQIALFFIATNLLAVESGLYLELGMGKGVNEKLNAKERDYSHKNATVGSLFLGYQADLYRVELEQSYRSSVLNSSEDIVQDTKMLNFYYSGYNHSKMVTTFGAGVGVTSVEVLDIESSNIFTYQAMFSIGYMTTQSITITPKYSYIRTVKSDDFDRNSDHLITLNIRYLF